MLHIAPGGYSCCSLPNCSRKHPLRSAHGLINGFRSQDFEPHPCLRHFDATLAGDHSYRFVLHDQDSIFSRELDRKVTAMGVRVLRTPVHATKANSICERFGGTLRRECLDFFIPLNERHLKLILKPWVAHFNHGRPHMSLGAGDAGAIACRAAEEHPATQRSRGSRHPEYRHFRRTPSSVFAGDGSMSVDGVLAEHSYIDRE